MKALLFPASIAEFLENHAAFPDALIMAGGTDLLVQLRKTGPDSRPFICLERISELREIQNGSGEIRIGAAAPLAEVVRHPLIAKHLPVLAKAAVTVGGPAIRNMGTIGGNICTASPAGDTLPPLYILGAKLDLVSQNGRRITPIHEFITGPRKTVLAPGELLAQIRIPSADGFAIQHFEKVGRRNALAIAVASLAAMIRFDDHGRIAEARLAWGSLGPCVVRSPEAENRLAGNLLSETILAEAGLLAQKAVSPIDDIRASADYRRKIAGNLLLRIAAP